MKYVLTLGRQPGLGLAELESLFGAQNVQPIGKKAALVSSEHIDFSRLGGSTRLCEYLGTISSADWQQIIVTAQDFLPPLLATLPEGKIRLGLSYIGQGISPKTINASGLSLKKIIKSSGRSVRIVPNSSPDLNTAQIIHNQLTGPTGIELVFAPKGNETVIARTITTQDIAAYAARDQKRPKRDARVGMLPPKLAQIIINLATNENAKRPPGAALPTPNSQLPTPTILDPFCGTGVVLQEALLMGYHAYGTDLEPRMVEYSKFNLDWLSSIYHLPANIYQVEAGDATDHTWKNFDAVACETYLGRPLSSEPTPEVLSKIIADCDTIHRKFLRNLARQTKPSFRACIAVPAWKTKNGFKHLKTLDNLAELGYNRIRLTHVRTEDLLYYRPDQLVARELVILQRI